MVTLGAEPPPPPEPPAVPPPTYKWDLVRRERVAGVYPWTHLYKPPLKDPPDSDHEYEPISPPPHALPSVRVTSIEGITIQEPPEGPDAEPVMSDNDSVGSPVRRPVEELNVPYDGEDEDRAMSSGEMGDTNGSAGGPEDEAGPTSDFEDDEMSVQQIQQQMEDRFFAPTPTTPESRTDGEFNTSQMDSSGLEDLPLTRDARRAAAAQPSTSADSTIQDRIRFGAGRLRTKIKNIKRPKMPQMQRPKFNMPSMPSLPKRPEFHLPDRPKFKMPERPKFSMPQRPKISLPSIASLSRGSSGSAGRSNSTKRPLRSRNFSSESTAGSSERKPMFDFKTYPRMFSRKNKQVRGDQSSSSPKSARSATPPPRLGLDVDDQEKTRKRSIGSRWVQKFTDIKFGEEVPEPKKRKEKENEKPPEEKPQSTSQQPHAKGDQLVYHISLHGSESEPDYSDDQFQGPPYPELPIADDLLVMDRAAREAAQEAAEAAQAIRAAEAEEAARIRAEAAKEAAREAARAASMEVARAAVSSEPDEGSQSHSIEQGTESHSIPASPGDSDRENRSSGTSSERHRRGVIEEIDSDEFFLRQKGISQEDVDMTRFISSEIREALRPPASALSRMDYGYYDDEEELENLAVHRNGGPPSRPVRTRSLRPRKKKGKKAIPATPPGDEAEEEWEDEEHPQPASYFNTFPPCRPQRIRSTQKQSAADKKRELEDERIEASVAIHREELGILAMTPAADDDVDEPPLQAPLPPRRLRKSTTTLGHDDVPMIDDEDFGQFEDKAGSREVSALHAEVDYIIPRAASREEVFDAPPVPPTRGRKSRSRGTSLADEDRTSRGAESLPSERDLDSEIIDDDIEITPRIDDYAFVDKSRTQPTKPERPRRPKPPRPPAPGRRKRAPPQSTASRIHSWGKQFFSLPGRRANGRQKQPPPTRPTRNYSTLGPARPPRRSGRALREQQVYSAYLEIEDDPSRTESQDGNRDLQSGDVISKMKDRPLPAPPRPPRKSRDHADFEEDECTQRILQEQLLREAREEDDDRELTYEERKRVLAALREEFFSHSGDQPVELMAELEEQLKAAEIPAEDAPVATDVVPQESPYKSLRKKKKVPPIPVEPPPEEQVEVQQEVLLQATPEERPYFAPDVPSEVPPEEVSIAIQTDPLPDDMCMEDSVAMADDMSISRTDGTTTTTSTTWPTVIEPDQTVAEDLPSVSTVLLREAPKDEQPPLPPQRPARRESAVPPPASTTTTVRVEIPETLRTERLQVADLDVDRLSVSELKANKITVSEIDGMSLGVSEINSRAGSLSLAGLELPSDLISQLLPVSQSLSHALTQSLSESLAQSLSHSLSHIQEALSQPAELIQQQQELQQQLQNLQQLQREQNQQQHEQLQQQQRHHQQQLLQAEQQQAAVLQQLQQQLQQLQIQPMPTVADVPPPIPPPPRNDAQSIQTQTSLETAVPPPPPQPPRSYSPDYVPGAPLPQRAAPLAPPRGARPRSTALELQESDEEIAGIVPTPSPSHSLRRRRHHTAHRVSTRYSSDEPEDDHHTLAVVRRHRGTVAEPTVGEVGRQLARACRASAMRALAALHEAAQPALGAAGGDPKRRDLQVALCLVLILVAAIILLGCGCGGSGVQHHHHWDFHFPPQL